MEFNINNTELLYDFGLQPVSNRFVDPNSSSKVPSFPLALRIQKDSGLIFLENPFPIEELKPRYDWLTCFEPEDHLDNMVETIINLPGISKDSVFGAYSFKDDSTLRRLEKKGFSNTWRIDPEDDLGVFDKCANVETYQMHLTETASGKIINSKGKADVLIVRHVIEHSYDLIGFINFIKSLVKPDGYIVWELPDCEHALVNGDCTTLWEEHIYYFTSFTFKRLLQNCNFEIVHYESVPYALENSLIAIVKSNKGKVTEEDDSGSISIELKRGNDFIRLLNDRKLKVREKLIKISKDMGTIAIFGAGHLTVAFISFMGISDIVKYVIDDNPNKKGMNMPIGNIPIVGSEVLYNEKINFCLLGLNPQNQPKVIEKHKSYTENGGVFGSIFPGSNLYFEDI
ncbi:class I SAM-dependent methyltransferase [Leptospira sp. GIMC2001]|uniref:class I SAM-dependent methyltransferase n=1 Tax=Leptospira sp. GIMC2001 TaxID=1513297 RepID=UPI00234B7FAC|nr:class I SAM-dependent methyltransferase [Leptospira sp. GIMC2001]WCL51206.1 methyltransferase domain-containing protein [Leptospira sp. GIMC2001]